MDIAIDGTSFLYRTDYQDDKKLRISFDALAQKTFGISFENWYQSGCWSDRYRPYSLMDGDEVVANVSVNPMDLRCVGQEARCVQLGTIMTAPDYRNRGLIHFLMARVLADWADKCDAVFLYANDSVLDFYPKFGFAPVREYRHSLPVVPDGKKRMARKLICGLSKDRAVLLTKYALNNPFSLLTSEHNPGLLLFYCNGSMRDCVYYIAEFDAVAVAEYDGEILCCHELFCAPGPTLQDMLTALARPETRRAVLGFTPKDGPACSVRPLREADTLYMLNGKKDLLGGRQLRFPALSHA